MAEITRNLVVPLIDTSKKFDKTKTGESDAATWVPIDLSTTFELAYNASTDTKSYICYKNDYVKLSSFQPSMDQEIALESTNPMWQFIEKLRRTLPVGGDAEYPVMIAMPPIPSGSDATPIATTDAQVWEKALIYVDTFSTTEGTCTFHIDFNGDPITGTVSGIGTAKVQFTPAS